MVNNIIYNWSYNDSKNRGKLWYIIAVAIILWLAIWWIFTWQYWLSFIVVLAAWIYLFVENSSSDVMNINITPDGIKVWTTFYNYWIIHSYSLIYDQETAVYLRLILNKKWIKKLDISIDNVVAKELKEILPNFIGNNNETELSWVDKLINILKL